MMKIDNQCAVCGAKVVIKARDTETIVKLLQAFDEIHEPHRKTDDQWAVERHREQMTAGRG